MVRAVSGVPKHLELITLELCDRVRVSVDRKLSIVRAEATAVRTGTIGITLQKR